MRNRRRLSLELLERREVLYAGLNPTVVLETNMGPIEFEMLEDAAPITVDNFLNYIEDGDYLDSIFHRLVPNFVLQGGGFTASTDTICEPTDCTEPDIFAAVPTDPTIVNEFQVSNTRGTVAMAKRGGDPNSATNQFFVNLRDNNDPDDPFSLDNQNGGFTVFARVNDMTTVDKIAALSTRNYSSWFGPTDPRGAIVAAPGEADAEQFQLVQLQSFSGSGGTHGTVFLDTNRNSVRDPGEGGRGGVVIYRDANENGLLDPDESRTTTNEIGDWHLRIDGAGDYQLRVLDLADYDDTGSGVINNSIGIGRTQLGLNFGTVYEGLSFHNARRAADVDGVNGITPLDPLLVINELDRRAFSDPLTGVLVTLSAPLTSPQFLDPDNNNIVSPIDALLVINELPSTGPTAALSSMVTTTTPSAEVASDSSNGPWLFLPLSIDTSERPGVDQGAAWAAMTNLTADTKLANDVASRAAPALPLPRLLHELRDSTTGRDQSVSASAPADTAGELADWAFRDWAFRDGAFRDWAR